MSQSSITILPAEKQLDDQNWPSFKNTLISLARGRGLEGYLTGAIQRSVAPTWNGHPTPANSIFPSTEEWDLCDGLVSALLYQNIKDPEAHGLEVNGTAHLMWVTL
ncbi:hypothetical protein FB451DRAFT_1053102, partial [Mycena latifolia]